MLTAEIRAAVERLRLAGVESPEREAWRLVGLALGISPEMLWAHRPSLTEPARRVFEDLVARRAAREPFAYLAGAQEFYGRRFKTPRGRVLIPRPETETVVETVLDTLGGRMPALVDVGTGSGAIAVTLKCERPAWRIWATDVSCEALMVAQANAWAHGAPLTFCRADLLQGLPVRNFDAIVANLPYVAPGERVAPETRFEPRRALYAEDGGIRLIARLIAMARGYLAPKGMLFLEVGIGQATAVASLLASAGFRAVRQASDLSGIARVVYGET